MPKSLLHAPRSISRCLECARFITKAGWHRRRPTAHLGTLLQPPKDIVNGVKWELYDITKDWTQNDDIAAANPAKLKELQDLFWVEANKYQVLPLDASAFTRVIAQRPSIVAGRTEFEYLSPVTGILPGNEPNVLNKSYLITADITVPENGGDGVLVTDGGRFGVTRCTS